jgi:hypothetical protein
MQGRIACTKGLLHLGGELDLPRLIRSRIHCLGQSAVEGELMPVLRCQAKILAYHACVGQGPSYG